MRLATTIALLAVALSAPVCAAEGMSTAKLRGLCLSQSGTPARFTCSGYLVGYVDGAAIAETVASSGHPLWCSKDVDNDVGEAFLRYSKAHPEDDARPAAVTLYFAMTEAYPCK